MMERTHQQTVIITGASSGIGAAVATTLAQKGYRLFLTGRDAERLNVTLQQVGPQHKAFTADITAQEEVSKLFDVALESFGPFYGMVHCAAISPMVPLRFLSNETLVNTLQSNLTSAFYLLKAFSQKKARTSESRAIFVSSLSAHHGQASLSAYCASKAGLEGAVRAWAMELASEGIRVNAIAPGCVETPMFQKLKEKMTNEYLQSLQMRHPLGFGHPEDVANVVDFFLSHNSRWITGTILHVDGGFHAS